MTSAQKEFLALLPPGTTLHAMHTTTTRDGITTINQNHVFVRRPEGMSVCVLVKLDRLKVIVAPRGVQPPEDTLTACGTLAECAEVVAAVLSKYELDFGYVTPIK